MLQKVSWQGETDHELWLKFRNGDPKAYESILERFAKPMFNYGIRLENNRDLISDCIQDVFCELWSKREKINHTESVKYYLFKSLRIRLINELKKSVRTENIDENYSFEVEFNIESTILNDERTIEIKTRLAKSINKLPDRQREILYLRYYEQMSHERIAQVMNLSIQSIYNLLYKSLTRLRKEWVALAFFILRFLHN
jgi:RNA polymerase sigma factor (sigma-70 family)